MLPYTQGGRARQSTEQSSSAAKGHSPGTPTTNPTAETRSAECLSKSLFENTVYPAQQIAAPRVSRFPTRRSCVEEFPWGLPSVTSTTPPNARAIPTHVRVEILSQPRAIANRAVQMGIVPMSSDEIAEVVKSSPIAKST
jgi:hypothetical protein